MAPARSATRSARGAPALRGLLLLLLGLGLAGLAFYLLLAPGDEEEIDDDSRARLERVLREADRATPEAP